MLRRLIRSAALAAWLPSLGLAQSRPTVRPADYGKWESLGAGTLAPNGQWLAYYYATGRDGGGCECSR